VRRVFHFDAQLRLGIVEGGSMVGLVTRAAVRLVVVVLALCAGSAASGQSKIGGPFLPNVREGLDFSAPSDWKLANRNVVPGGYSVLQYVRQGDDIKDLGELLTVQEVSGKPDDRNPEMLLNELRENREKTCPDATTWTVLAKDSTSILYEWESTSCGNQPEQHEIARIIVGQLNVYFVRYARKTAFDDATRGEWMRRLSEARVARR
jgi:hypothetical protein